MVEEGVQRLGREALARGAVHGGAEAPSLGAFEAVGRDFEEGMRRFAEFLARMRAAVVSLSMSAMHQSLRTMA